MNLILFEQNDVTQKTGMIFLPAADIRAVHLKKILKAEPGTVFDAGFINSSTGKAEIISMENSGIEISFTPEAEPVGLHPLTLLLGLSRPPTVKKVLKEATALGVGRFILCGTENGERSYRQSSLLQPEKIHDVLIEGVQQACCTMMPEVEICYSVKNAAELASRACPEGSKLVGLDNYEAVTSLTEYWQSERRTVGTADADTDTDSGETAPSTQHTVLAVGSERGWTDSEREILRNSGYTLCSLGSRVLRTETASIAGAALCLSGMGLI